MSLDGSGYVHTYSGQPGVSERSTRATAWPGLDLLYARQLRKGRFVYDV